MEATFDRLLLLGRPAAGKSELIDCLRGMPEAERAREFHVGPFEELDDFVWIWEKFLEDDLWEEAGCGRLYSHREGENYGLEPHAGSLFDMMLARFNREYRERFLSRPEFFRDGTLFIEFSRGGQVGYAHSLPRLSDEILRGSAILYVEVSFEESWRRNLTRYEEKRKHSVLAHMATRRVMEAFYRENDWAEVSGGGREGFVEVRGARLPFVTVVNEPEIKEPGPLAKRYRPAFERLHELFTKRSPVP